MLASKAKAKTNLFPMSRMWLKKNPLEAQILKTGELVWECDGFRDEESYTYVLLTDVLPRYLIHDLEDCSVSFRQGPVVNQDLKTGVPFKLFLEDENATNMLSFIRDSGRRQLTFPKSKKFMIPRGVRFMDLRFEGCDYSGQRIIMHVFSVPIVMDNRLVAMPPRRPGNIVLPTPRQYDKAM
ncbi:MAG: hypothetical protein ACOYUZ_00985 [Patescibacteria group bacterium]